LQPTDRITLPERAGLVRRMVVTGLADADALFRQVTAQLRERGWLSPQTVIVVIGDGSEGARLARRADGAARRPGRG
jgi:hypothetical protein